MSRFCRCRHSRGVHAIAPSTEFNRDGYCLLCDCKAFERPLAINTPTDAEKRAEIRLLSGALRARKVGEA